LALAFGAAFALVAVFLAVVLVFFAVGMCSP